MSAIPESVEYHLPFDPTLLMTFISLSLVVLLSVAATRKMKAVPKGAQNVLEMILNIIYKFADDLVGPGAAKFYPLFVMLFFFILFSNIIGLIPGLFSGTSKLTTTAGLALIVFFTTHYFGIKEQGLIKYIKHWTGPVPGWLKPLMFFIEVIGELARPVSLAFRLFGNILAKEILLGVLALLVVIFLPSSEIVNKFLALVPIILRPLIILLGVLVSVIQAFIFMMLAMIYIGGAVQAHDEH